ncbi:MAG: helix-turn-helix transcriptional regulator [Planctomycetota bacterium]
MPDIKSVLNEEIRRLARKEIKAHFASVKDTSKSQKAEISELKKTVRTLEKQVERLSKQKPVSIAASASASDDDDKQTRFSPVWLKKHREKLGISAADYAKLVGSSALSIYKWEKGESNPRRAQREALAAVRGLGIREVQQRLDEIDQEG